MSEVVDGVRELLGKLTPTETAIANLHKEKTCPKHPDPLTLWAVATVYEKDLAELDPAAAEAIDNVIAIAEARRRHPQPGRESTKKTRGRTTRDKGDAMHTWIPKSPDRGRERRERVGRAA